MPPLAICWHFARRQAFAQITVESALTGIAGRGLTTVPFDTLKLTKALQEKAHFTQTQAEGLTEALSESFKEQIATKKDIADLNSRTAPHEQDRPYDHHAWDGRYRRNQCRDGDY